MEKEAQSPVAVYNESGYGKVETGGVAGEEAPHLQRKLQSRHLAMIAIGGTIGTGLFLASGKAVHSAGPVGILIAYAVVGLQVYGVITSLGEMATQFPVAGAFSQMGTRFLSHRTRLLTKITAAELVAAGILMGFWFPNVPQWIFSVTFLVPLVVVNLLGVRGFGEIEFTLSFIKIIAIIIFLLLSFVIVCGGSSALGPIGFKNWREKPLIAPDTAGKDGDSVDLKMFLAVMNAFPVAFYSYGGSELVGITAGEAANPEKSVPRAIKGTFWRIMLFYIGALFFVGLIIPYDDERLGMGDVQYSPFTLVYETIGIHVGSHIMNAVVLVAVLSAANSSIYACSRTLQGLAKEGKAFAFLGIVDRRGVPVYSLIVSVAFGCLAFLGSIFGNSVVFNLLSSILALAILGSWMLISLIHLRFRAAWKAQGRSLSELFYKAPLHPLGDILSLTVGFVVLAFLLYQAATAPWDPIANAQFYVGIPLFFFLYFGYKVYPTIANWIKPGCVDKKLGRLVPLTEVDFETDKLIVNKEDDDESKDSRVVPEGFGPKIKFYLRKAWNAFLG
ncbi:hypothetical protein HDU97_000225 [Phlyctochytrium planicorne]|nr:hypothetical protein HDU97_000225 [Phlyctochytrium planicorne]